MLNREFTTEESLMAKKHLRKCAISLGIQEMQNKTTLRFHLTLVRMAKIKTSSDSKDMEQEEHFIAGGSANIYNHFGNQFDRFSANLE